VLVDGGDVVAGSLAILAHLCERWPEPPLFPRRAGRDAVVKAYERVDGLSVADLALASFIAKLPLDWRPSQRQPRDLEGGMPESNPYKDEIIISWVELHRDARYLSQVLHDMGEWKGIIAITRGGLVPAALVARELDIRLIDTVCVVSYGASDPAVEAKTQGKLQWLKSVEGDGDGWLLIDDLVDTGGTARAVRERLPKAHFACLYAKPLGRPVVDTFVKEFKQEKWIYFPWDIDYRFVSPIKAQRR
jgi:xanthine phosphoribosyltransferase